MKILTSLVAVISIAVAQLVLAQSLEEPTPYQVLYAEWKAEEKKLEGEYPALPKVELSDKKRQIRKEFTPRFVKLAEDHLDNENVWLYCLLWTVQNESHGTSFERMFDLLTNNVDKVQNRADLLVGAMDSMHSSNSNRISPALELIASSHHSNYVRGNALFTLALRTKRIAEAQGDPTGCADAEKLLQRVISEYPEIRNGDGLISDLAGSVLEDLRSPVAITREPPIIRGATISGEPIELKDFRGHVTVLSFSGHWCVPCVAMHRVQKAMLERFPEHQLRVIEINSDKPDALGGVQQTMQQDGLSWVVIADGRDLQITKAWRIKAHPTYYVIDANGRIRHRGVGAIGNQLVDWVAALVRP